MCVAKNKCPVEPKHDEDGTLVNESQSTEASYLNENLPEHIDDPLIDTSIEQGIHGFIYENSDQVTVVYTSDHAFELYNTVQSTSNQQSETQQQQQQSSTPNHSSS